MAADVVPHPEAKTGSVFLGDVVVAELPPPPGVPALHLANFPTLSATVESDACVTFVHLLARCVFDRRVGWMVKGGKEAVAAWNGWGLRRASSALVALEKAGLVGRFQQRQVSDTGSVLFSAGVLVLRPTREEAPLDLSPVSSGKAATVEDRDWGPPLLREDLVKVLESMDFDGAEKAVDLYGTQKVSDAVRATLFRALKGKVDNPGGYLRSVLKRNEIAAPPASLEDNWMASLEDLLRSVQDVSPPPQLSQARASWQARQVAVDSVWNSLPEHEREGLDEELSVLSVEYELLPERRRAWRVVQLKEQLLAEQGLLAKLPED